MNENHEERKRERERDWEQGVVHNFLDDEQRKPFSKGLKHKREIVQLKLYVWISMWVNEDAQQWQ